MNITEKEEGAFNRVAHNDVGLDISRTSVRENNSRPIISTKTEEQAQQRRRDIDRTVCDEKIISPKLETNYNVKTPCLQQAPKMVQTSGQSPSLAFEVLRNKNSDLTVESVKERKTSGDQFSASSSSAVRKLGKANGLQRKVKEQNSRENTAKQEIPNSSKSEDGEEPMESAMHCDEDGRHLIPKPDTRSRLQKLMARRRGELEKPFRRVVIVKPFNVVSTLDARLSALDRAIARDFHDDMVMARQVLMPRLFQRTPKLHERWRLTYDVRVLQEVLLSLHSARERREERRNSQQNVLDNTEASSLPASEDQSSDKLQLTESASTPESLKRTPGRRVGSPQQPSDTGVSLTVVAVAVVHAEADSQPDALESSDVAQPDDNDEDSNTRPGDQPATETTSPKSSGQGQRTSADSGSVGLLQDQRRRRSKVAYANLSRDHDLVRSYTTLAFRPSTTAPPTASVGKQLGPPASAILERRSTNTVTGTAPGRLRRTVTSLSVARGRLPAPHLSKAMMDRIQDVQQIYGSQQ